jgi:lysophospholipase L1-like esterase
MGASRNAHNTAFQWLVILSAGLLFPGCLSNGPAAPDRTSPGGAASHGISAFSAKRYIDRNGNGIVDMPNTAAYVQAPLKISVKADRLARSYPSIWPYTSTETAGFGSTAGPWRWTFTPTSPGSVPQGLTNLPTPVSTVPGRAGSNDGQRVIAYSTVPRLQIDMFEGDWSVELARIDASGAGIYWKTATFKLNDTLIVQLGDSYSSGEGAPDRPPHRGFWGDDGTGANGAHAAAHRSSNTWGSLFALDVEKVGQLVGTSVTYVNLAVSGALISEVDAQLAQLPALVGPRKVDFLLISVGGNDAGFTNAISAYLIREPIAGGLLGPSLTEIEQAIRSGDWTGGPFTDVGSVVAEMFDGRTDLRNVRGVGGLTAGYAHLARQFQSYGIEASRVFILQYPDPLVPIRGNPGEVCPEPILRAVSNIGRQLEIGRAEQQHARSNLIGPINQRIASMAASSGWNLIAAEDVMYGHAICQDDRMIRRFNESYRIQGDEKGALHPNYKGYEAIAKRAFESIR